MYKQKGQKIISFTLIFGILFSSLAGCGNNKAPDSTSGQSDVSGSDASTAQVTTVARNNRNEDNSYNGPLTDEPYEFTAFVSSGGTFTTGTFTEDVITNNPTYQKIADNTNVKIKWIVPTSGEESNQFNLMIASGEYPDFIFGSSSMVYPGGFDQAIDDGVFFDMTPYAEEYMPNYLAAIKANDQIYKEATTLKGLIPATFNTYDPEYEGKSLQWVGQAIRSDILEELNLAVPETMKEWETVLTAMKDYGIEVPYSMGTNTGMDASFLSAYGIAKPPVDLYSQVGVYPNDEGILTYGAIEPAYKDYLTTMNRWYANGLLDPEFMTRSAFTVPETIISMYGNGQIGSIYTADGALPTMVLASESNNPSAKTVAVPAPRLNKDDTVKITIGKLYSGGGSYTAITTKCSDPYLAMNFLDYMCTEEGILLSNFGIEGESYTMVDGVPIFTDLVMKSETGTADSVRRNTAMQLAIIGQEKTRNLQFKTPENQEWNRIWTESSEQVSTVYSLTSEEELKVASIMSDISTYVQEQTIKAIIDKTALEDWDKTIETIQSMNLKEALKIYQTGYDRYNNR